MGTTVNYTEAQEAIIRAAAPLDMDSAREIAGQIGKSHRSVIAKAKNMGVEYRSKPKPQKRVGGMQKTEMVEKIGEQLGGVDLTGLEKSPSRSLATLLEAVTNAS